jgi:hypothetical protein
LCQKRALDDDDDDDAGGCSSGGATRDGHATVRGGGVATEILLGACATRNDEMI